MKVSGSTKKKDEAELARHRNQRLQDALASKRSWSIALAAILAVIAAVAWTAGSGMAAFCLLVVSLILLLRYFDANSHLHEVRRRSSRSLVPNFSLLEAENRGAGSGQAPMVHDSDPHPLK